jgi:hypothetical protein
MRGSSEHSPNLPAERSNIEQAIKSRLRSASRILRACTAFGLASSGVGYVADIKPLPLIATPILTTLAIKNNRKATGFCTEKIDAYETTLSSHSSSVSRYQQTRLLIQRETIIEQLEHDKRADIERVNPGLISRTELFSMLGSAGLGILGGALAKNGLPSPTDIPAIGGIATLLAGSSGSGLYLGSEHFRMKTFQRQLDNIDGGPVSINVSDV